jgi:hypothetical protein
MSDRKITLIGGQVSIPRVDYRQTYFVGAYSKKGTLKAVKVGSVSRGQVKQRVRNLQTGSLDKLVLLALYNGNIERRLHRQFADSRIRKSSEYFKPTPALMELIKKLSQINRDLERLERSTEGSAGCGADGIRDHKRKR